MRDDYTEWERFSHPDPDEEDPPTLDEVQTLREFAESFGTANAIAAEDAARQLMSLVDEGRVVEKRQNNIVDKGERVSWLLWDAAIDMPRYQPAILKLIEAIRALPQLERTEEQIRTGCFEDRLETWRSLEAFNYIWSETYSHCWEMRYGPYPYYGWTDFHSANAFYAHFLAAYPPESPDLRELTVALRLIVFALEQDPWTHAKQPPPQWQGHSYRDTGRPTDYMQMLNADVHAMVPFFEIAGHIIFGFMGKRDLSLLEKLKKGTPIYGMETHCSHWKDGNFGKRGCDG
ncbi:hypothetical protein CNMCM7691_003823 [Aspergillus felis]|uniref:Uncharacterized protein n=1 Tax=Aspergillus felis TaxID=1287682 RepID=A0A8H6R370_9EURO|nr:hypothetical protein CNMCM7691_003823 [Aspergillus felis]